MTITEYYDSLNRHDWFHGLSEDRRARDAGSQQESILKKLAATSPDHFALYAAFYMHHKSVVRGEPTESPKRPEEI